MDNHAGAAAVRAAVERIQAERKDWQGVGLMAIEHLETGACGVVLVPADAPVPDWSQELCSNIAPWLTQEDFLLPNVLWRWHADLSSRPDERWTEWTNLLRRHCPAALAASLPRASRQLAVGHGFVVRAPRPAAGDDLLGRLVAWALPWQELPPTSCENGAGGRNQTRVCASWLNPPGLVRMWTVDAALGAAGLDPEKGGRDPETRLREGGMVQWGVLVAWPSAIDVLVGFLLAQADAMDCAGGPTGPLMVRRHEVRLNQAQRRALALAIACARVEPIRREDSQSERCRLAIKWFTLNRESHVSPDELRRLDFPGLSAEWCNAAVRENPAGCSVGSLVGVLTKLTAEQLRKDVSKAVASAAPRSTRSK